MNDRFIVQRLLLGGFAVVDLEQDERVVAQYETIESARVRAAALNDHPPKKPNEEIEPLIVVAKEAMKHR